MLKERLALWQESDRHCSPFQPLTSTLCAFLNLQQASVTMSFQGGAHGASSTPLAAFQVTLPMFSQCFPLRQHPGLLCVPQT